MKKTLSLIVAAIIALSALVSLASCGGSDGIVGEWKTEVNFVEMLGDEASASLSFLGENVLDAFKDKTLGLSLNFKDDGKVTAEVDKDSYLEFMKDLVGGWVSEEELEKSIDEQNGAESEYKYENGELTLGDTVFKAEISGDKLILSELVSAGDGESSSMANLVLPIEFTRQ